MSQTHSSAKGLKCFPAYNVSVNHLYGQPLTFAQSLIIDHFNINPIRNQFFDFQELFLNKADTSLILGIQFYYSFLVSQCYPNGHVASQRSEQVGGDLIMFMKEKISWKVVNTFHSSEEISLISVIVTDFSISNNKRLHWGSHKSPSENEV